MKILISMPLRPNFQSQWKQNYLEEKSETLFRSQLLWHPQAGRKLAHVQWTLWEANESSLKGWKSGIYITSVYKFLIIIIKNSPNQNSLSKSRYTGCPFLGSKGLKMVKKSKLSPGGRGEWVQMVTLSIFLPRVHCSKIHLYVGAVLFAWHCEQTRGRCDTRLVVNEEWVRGYFLADPECG